LDRADILKVYP